MSDTQQLITEAIQLKDCLDLRSHIEEFAARLAAQRAGMQQDAENLLAAYERLEQMGKTRDPVLFHQADWELHRCIMGLAGVPGLLQAWEVVAGQVSHFTQRTLADCWPDLQVLVEGHRDLVDAIANGDEVEAAELAAGHLSPFRYRLEKNWQQGDATMPLDLACAYLGFRLHRPIRLSELASEVGVTSGHLARLFRTHLSTSFNQYLRRLRMDRARRLLARTHQSIGKIARRVGYLDASRFSEHFQKETGQTPSEYRRRSGKLDPAP